MIMAKNIILITGASSGIGQEFARQIDPYFSNIDEIWLVARSRSKLEETAGKLRHRTRVLAMDITKEAQLERLEDTLTEHRANIRMLINCAGFGLMGDFTDIDLEGQLGMVRLNCEALTHMTYRCLPFMHRRSRIIQMASSAAFLPQPGFAVYAASKSYVLSFSRALGEELKQRGIYVTSVCPGPVDTPFFDIAEKYGATLSVKKLTMVDAARVVEKALKDSYYCREMSVCSLPIQAFEVLTKCVPHHILLKAVAFVKGRDAKRQD